MILLLCHVLCASRRWLRADVMMDATILDRIDYNIEQAADRVGNAVVELNKANEYQKKSRTMLCIYILLLLCGFMVIVLILKKSATSGSSER